MTKLVINNLTCQYDKNTVIDNLSLKLENNEIVALLGPSGCGKTTLLRAIAGLQSIAKGEIYLSDKLISSATTMLASEKRNIGIIFQDYALFPHLTVAQNIAFGLTKLSAEESKGRVDAMLNLVKLTDFATRYPHEISGGQQQRVAIARALAYQPDIMLLDEPFSNIDSQSRGEIMAEIRQILKAQGVPAVFVTHSKDEAFAFADKLAIFNQGKIEQIDSAQALYQQPVSPYVADFMGKANYLEVSDIHQHSVSTVIGDIAMETMPIDISAMQKDKRHVVMIRPEQLELSANDNGKFAIESSMFCGSYWLHSIICEQSSAEPIEVHSHLSFDQNTRVDVSVSIENAVTFIQP